MGEMLRDRKVAITGAFGALGQAVTQAVLEAGAKVAAIDRAAQIPAGLRSAGVLTCSGVNLSDADVADATFNSVAQQLGGIDALVNLAGTFRWETVAAGSIATWDLLYDVNLRTAVSASRSAVPHLLKNAACGRGRVINIGAAAAICAGAGMGAYAAAKSGVSRFTEALAAELADSGITVNALLPSILDTPSNRAAMPDAQFDRWVKLHEAADVVIFLLSAQSSAITGASIPLLGRQLPK